MMMQGPLRVAGAAAALIAVLQSAALAQTWNWTYSSAGVPGAQGPSAATLDLGSGEIKTSNRIAMAGRPDVVYGCSIRLRDVSRAIAVHAGSPALLIELKPHRAADCQMIGRPQSIVLDSDDGALVDRVAAAINDACCAVAPSLPASPPPKPVVLAAKTPAPRPRTTAGARAVRARARPNAPAHLVRAGLGEPVPGKSGTVAVRVVVGADGSPQDATVVSSTNDDLDDAAIEIAGSSTYAAAVRSGRPASAAVVVTIAFLDGDTSVSATESAR